MVKSMKAVRFRFVSIKNFRWIGIYVRGTQRKYSSKPLKHSIVERILVFKQVDIGIFLSPKNFLSARIP